MSRKWTILAAVLTAVTLTATGFSLADEDSPMHQLMEKVNAKSNSIKKATRSAVAYKKSQAELPKQADELIEYGKQFRDMKDASEKQKRPLAEWQKLTDDFIKKTQEFKVLVSKPATTQEQAKTAYNKSVYASCTECHKIFRVEDEN